MSTSTTSAAAPVESPDRLLALYDEALPQVYRYLYRAVGGSRTLAEDLTSETFLAAAQAARRGQIDALSVPWLIRVARNKMVDHFRRLEREQRKLAVIAGGASELDPGHDWDTVTADQAQRLLQGLSPEQRAAVALRYLDDLPVAEVAHHLDRSVEATESLLARARRRLRELAEEDTDV